MNFSLRLTQALASKSLTQKELSILTKIPQSAISNYCAGKSLPNVEGLYKLSKALDMSMEWFMEDKDIKESEHKPVHSSDTDYWRHKAKTAEEKLEMLKASLGGLLNNI